MNDIKLIIADDHELFRNGLVELLKKHDDIKIVKSVADGFEFMNVIKEEVDADIVLLDLTMPEMDGFQVLKELKNLNAKIRPIVISMHSAGNYIAKCARMGAYGYLLKNTDESELIFAIRTVYKGKKYFSAEISEKMINFMSAQSVSENVLSKKETNILKKLEVKNTAELIKKATEINLI